ncbi:YusW family protein [Psychrobacillus psychrodurans]|uniref:YusW family protein n=1 Tax=Psychrobacillus psychrodurans TaxID=126157 RepID=UPI0008E33401|nr:YusW family protein [Psychrobacillus psychrodurans]MCZ8538805.1 YusW family protein [Psychrobacillus psychrodurans]SFM22283.1 YusW-like protein [Psychrobacillus psychrodurans]
MKIRKYPLLGSVVISSFLLLGACGDKEEVSEAPDKETAQSEFGFQSFELDVDTADQKDAIDASFDIDISETEAEYFNQLESKNLSGNDAYTELEPIFKEIALTKDMSKEEVIEKVTQAFGVEEYTEFELEVEFSDGDTQEFNDRK